MRGRTSDESSLTERTAASAMRRSSRSRDSFTTSCSPLENGITALLLFTTGARSSSFEMSLSAWAASIDRWTN